MGTPVSSPVHVLATDHRVVVVDKPAGLTAEDVARALDRRLVHRIDRATSGLLLLADDARTVQRMQRLLAQARVTRTYLALARGAVASGLIDRALSPAGTVGRRHAVDHDAPGAVPAKTQVDVFATSPAASLVRATLVTGRTHQVRIHLADAGHPLLGDRVYGGDVADAAPRLMLHAWRLSFVHPNSHAPVAFDAPPPADFAAVVAQRCGDDALASCVRP